MGKIIDANALYNIGRATTGDVRDNRARDAFMAVLGAKALQLIGNAFVTRQKGRKKGAETLKAVYLSKCMKNQLLLQAKVI
jgi:hypothetical protein